MYADFYNLMIMIETTFKLKVYEITWLKYNSH